ncbi:MAG: hypothetical protein ABR511_09220, partial [Acidimicrobiales bacterium]
TWRVVAFVVALVGVLGVAVVAIGWYARHTYYVGLAGDRVAIYKGRPGGLVWFEPTLQERKPLTTADILPSRLPDLRSGHEEPTKADADRYVNELRIEGAERAGGTGPGTGPGGTGPGTGPGGTGTGTATSTTVAGAPPP